MKNLLFNYGLQALGNPLRIICNKNIDFDKAGQQDPFSMHYVWTPHKEKFPLDVPLPHQFDICSLRVKNEGRLCMASFTSDVNESEDYFLIGIQGIILLGLQYPDAMQDLLKQIPRTDRRAIVSPAYAFGQDRVLCDIGEARVPWFCDHEGKISISFSRSVASSIRQNDIVILGRKIEESS